MVDQDLSVISKGKRYIPKFDVYLHSFQLCCKTLPIDLLSDPKYLPTILEKGIRESKNEANFQTGDKIRIIARNDNFKHPISTETKTDTNVEYLLQHVANILTSNESVKLEETVFDVQIFKIPRGCGRHKMINLAEDRQTKRSITQIKNNDSLCGARAIVTALTYHTHEILEHELTDNDVTNIRKGRRLQSILAKKLCHLLGGSYEEGFNLEDFKQAEELLNVQIKIICAENFNNIIYQGTEKTTKIYLYKNKNHFDVINSLTGLYGKHFYCEKCDTSYDGKNKHKCKKTPLCTICKQAEHDLSTKNKVLCEACNRFCFNTECFDNHTEVCKEVFKCPSCNKTCKREHRHECGYSVCKNCKTFVEIATHQCYMVKKPAKGGFCTVSCLCNKKTITVNKGCQYNTKSQTICNEPCLCNGLSDDSIPRCTYNEKYIFFDYETMQDTEIHIPNLIIAHDFEGNKFDFKDNEEFCRWLISEKHRGYTAIAHNSKSYDSYFILKYCVENTIKPDTIYNGSKLMLLEVSDIKLKIIDSSNFIAGPLADFPKTFGLRELKKGYFPHFFNTPENQGYKGSLPATEYYGPNTMKPKQRNEFLKWHEEHKNDEFDFSKELHAYCDSDVDILRRGCLEFRREFMGIANIDPFQYLTIAGVCMAIYRAKYLQTGTLGVVKQDLKEMYSEASIKWLNQFPNIQHALIGGEVTICGAKVDGYDPNTNTVYQYNGCFWHGHPECYAPDTINRANKETMSDLYERTVRRVNQIKEAGYNLVEIWECEWLKSKEFKNAPDPQVVESLKPRDAFFGGRTNAIKLKVTDKKLRYIDIVSLYPTVQYYDSYPVGHPVKIYAPESYDPTWFGLVHCQILPPYDLYHPVLPIKTDKLMFPLCHQCVVDSKVEDSKECNHNDSERVLTGTWTTLEINKALEKGYKIIKIHEVWNFEKTSTDLFKGYVNDFIKIKLESSPHTYVSNEEYAREVKDQMDIDLDLTKISINPGRRAVAKICLNSLWGKFGQRQNLKQTEYITDPKKWYEKLLDDKINISNVIFINDNIAQVSYDSKDEFVEDPTSTNIFIAIFTTSNARLRLYEMIDKLGEAVAYFDTDSIVYIDDGKNTVKTGDMLGDWSDELGTDDYIIDWRSTGPKSYYYKTHKGKEVTKIKGFTLNYENSQVLNGQTMSSIIDDPSQKVTLYCDQIDRETQTKDIVTKKRASKTFRMSYKKRKTVHSDETLIDTKPLGFKTDNPE
ncbi:uncharacterized protein LOC114327599 [Diabrotica virgifera virgifera]|uniref:DNA-directed DNA polymerase n=1 Tax=Diabrotica virgifera virgifera TaxID=50390 RepID=A0A6P7FFQ8_DIAVI|nr:uncharacterized protein LOC114327599 [Diabrotica virgifera virgifera]